MFGPITTTAVRGPIQLVKNKYVKPHATGSDALAKFWVEKNYLDTLNTYEVHIPLSETH